MTDELEVYSLWIAIQFGWVDGFLLNTFFEFIFYVNHENTQQLRNVFSHDDTYKCDFYTNLSN